MISTRRQFLAHLGAVGLGLVLNPSLGSVARAEEFSGVLTRPDHLVLETVEASGLAHYSYFVGDKIGKVAMVIDPRRDIEVYLELARKHGMTITHVLDTHIHADFLSGARELAARVKTAKICASVEGDPEYGYPIDLKLRHGDIVGQGALRLQALHTPGHTPEHMSFVALGSESGGSPWALFTGDFLFVGSVGRPDLMGVENTERLAKALYSTVKTGYSGLPDGISIYPAHGPGSPCGAGIQKATGRPTLGRERAANPYLNLDSEASFIEQLLWAQPPVPYYWPRMKKINAQGPEILGDVPKVLMLSAEQFHNHIQSQGVTVLDSRGVLDFAGGHIRGSVNIGHDPVLSLWGGWMFPSDSSLALVLPEGESPEDVSAWLARVGLGGTSLVALKGGMKDWMASGLPIDTFETMSIHEVRQSFPTEAMQLLDVRQPSEWDQGYIRGADYMFLPEIPQRFGELDKEKAVIVYCGSGYRASIAVSLLRRGGIDARTVPGSYGAWLAAGYPIEKPAQPKRASDTVRP